MDNFSAYRLQCFVHAVRMTILLSTDPQWAQHHIELQRLAIPGNDAFPGFDYSLLSNTLSAIDQAFPAPDAAVAVNPRPAHRAIQSINRQPCQHCKDAKKKASACLCNVFCVYIFIQLSIYFQCVLIGENICERCKERSRSLCTDM